MSDHLPLNDLDLTSNLRRRSADDSAAGDAWRRSFVAAVDRKMDLPQSAERRSRVPALVGLVGVAGMALVLFVALPRALPGAPATQTPTPQPVRSSASQDTTEGTFTLTIVAGSAEYGVNQPIDVHAEMLYEGPSESAVVTGVGRLVAGFGVEQVDGPYSMGPSWGQPCVPDSLVKGEPRIEEFRKSGAWDGADPLAGFYSRYLADPVFRLPAGTWRVTAYTEFWAGECGEGDDVSLETSVDLVVSDSPLPVVAPSQQPSTDPDAAPSTTAGTKVDCPGQGGLALIDRTGVIAGCTDLGVIDRHFQLGNTNPDGDLARVFIDWSTNVCVERGGADIEVTRSGERYRVSISEKPDYSSEFCDTEPGARAFELTMSQPADASLFDVVVAKGPPPATAEPHTPTPTATPISRTFECEPGPAHDGPVGGGLLHAVMIEDETGLVDHCQDAALESESNEPLIVDNADGNPTVLRLAWSGVCSISTNFVLRPHGDTFELVVTMPPPNVICDGSPISHDVRIFLSAPIVRRDLQVTYVQLPEVTPRPQAAQLECAAVGDDSDGPEVLFTDLTGLVVDCNQTDVLIFRDGTSPWSVVSTGSGEPGIRISWREPSCYGPRHLRFSAVQSGYVLTIEPVDADVVVTACTDTAFPSDSIRRGVVISLRGPVAPDDIEVWF